MRSRIRFMEIAARLGGALRNVRGSLLTVAMLLPCLATLPGVAHSADAPATVTILEGEALIYRGLVRLHAAPGVRLALGDILETGDSTLMQIEMPDRSI